MSGIPEDYPIRIRRLRGRLGLTQAAFAKRMGVSFATVNRWENGQAKPSALAWKQIEQAETSGVEYRGDEPNPLVAGEPTVWDDAAVVPDFSAEPEAVRTVAESMRLAYGHLFNPKLAAEVSLVEPLPHQRIAVYDRLLKLPRIRFLLADDPGGGKTIMSGLLLRELLSRRIVRRALVVPPAGLVGNWKSEMWRLFRLPFQIVVGSDARTRNPFAGEGSDLVIVSMDTLAGERTFARLKEDGVAPYDIVFIDEAHKLSAFREADFTITKRDRYKLAEALLGVPSDEPRWMLPWSCTHAILLTATPHMGREYPFYALFRLLDHGVFSTLEAFHSMPSEFRARYFLRRTKEEMVDFDGKRIYPTRVSDTLACEMSPAEQELYRQTTDYIATHYNRARILNRSAARLAMSVFQRRLTSSTWALLRSFERRLARLDELIEQFETGRLTERQLDEEQQRLLQTLPDPLDAESTDEAEPEDGAERSEVLENEALAGVVSSSLPELRAERERVQALIALARATYEAADDSKFTRLLQVTKDPRFAGEKLLVFTEHRDTADFLVRRLEGMGHAGEVARIHGGMEWPERQEQVELFRKPADQGGARFMVCTDAAAEGINLQFCWLMVNYDIPWNPARLEQRMGRIHRFGQRHDPVFIVNLVSDPEHTREGRVLFTVPLWEG